MNPLRRRHPSPPPAADASHPLDRVGAFLLWIALPTLSIGLVVAYVALAIAWHANPPVVPVTGHSMQPKLHAGDLVFIKGVDPRTLRKGDIIAFRTTAEMQKKYDVPPEYVHRIVNVGKEAGSIIFRTKGDNVPGKDPFVTYQHELIGEYAGKVVGGGYPILFFRSRQGIVFGVAVLCVLLLYFVFGFWERRQEAIESNAVTMEQMVAEARALRDSMAAAAGRSPYEAAAAAGLKMVDVRGEPPPGTVLCSLGCHVLLPGAVFDPHTGAPVDIPARAPSPADTFVPIPSSRALVPYVPAGTPPIDFEKLEREIHEAVRSSAAAQETMSELVGAIGEYGEHLRSHTAVVRNLAAATGDLQATTAELRQFVASLTSLLATLVEQQGRSSQPPVS